MNEHEVCAVLFFSLHIKHLSQHSRPAALKVGEVQACISPVRLSLLSSVLSLRVCGFALCSTPGSKECDWALGGGGGGGGGITGGEWAWALSTSVPMALTF